MKDRATFLKLIGTEVLVVLLCSIVWLHFWEKWKEGEVVLTHWTTQPMQTGAYLVIIPILGIALLVAFPYACMLNKHETKEDRKRKRRLARKKKPSHRKSDLPWQR